MTCFWGPVNGHRSWSCWYRSDGFTFPPSIDEVLHPCSQTAVIWYLLSSYYVHRLRFCVRKCYTWSDTHRAHHIEPDIELKKVNSQYKWSDLRPRIRLGAVVLAKKSRSEIRLLHYNVKAELCQMYFCVPNAQQWENRSRMSRLLYNIYAFENVL